MQFWLSAVLACALWLLPLVLLGPGFSHKPHGWGGRLRESMNQAADEDEKQRMMESASRDDDEQESEEEEPVEFVPVTSGKGLVVAAEEALPAAAAPTAGVIAEEVPAVPTDSVMEEPELGPAVEAKREAESSRALGAERDTESKTIVEQTADAGGESEASDTSNELEEELDVHVDLTRSVELKNEANTLIAQQHFDEALELYKQSLDLCPRNETAHAAIIYSNMSYAKFQQGDHEGALADASSAIELNPNYAKGFLRRYKAHRALDKIHDACADLKAAVEVDPKLHASYRQELLAIEHESNERANKEKEEMIGKLKEFGNWALGKVGMSLDNFQVVQDPNSGSYNIQYQPPQQAPNTN